MHNILIVDDDDLVRKTISLAVERAGYKAITAANAEEALKSVKEQKFSLILSDIRMPGKDGVQTIKEIRQFFKANAGPDIPIIFITGYADMGQELNAEELGEVILKPFNFDHMLMTIREYL